MTKEWNLASSEMSSFIGSMKYRLRLVCMQKELIEKIKIFDAGYDDVVIEILKEGYRMMLEEKGKKGIHIYFDSIDEKSGMMKTILCGPEEDERMDFPVGPLYLGMKNIADSIENNDNELKIKYVDNLYAEKVMQAFANKEESRPLRLCPICNVSVTPTFHGLCPNCDNEIG
jgi:hypothetical protein